MVTGLFIKIHSKTIAILKSLLLFALPIVIIACGGSSSTNTVNPLLIGKINGHDVLISAASYSLNESSIVSGIGTITVTGLSENESIITLIPGSVVAPGRNPILTFNSGICVVTYNNPSCLININGNNAAESIYYIPVSYFINGADPVPLPILLDKPIPVIIDNTIAASRAGTISLAVASDMFINSKTMMTVTLSNSAGVESAVNVALTSNNKVSLNESSCGLTTQNPTCNVEVTASSQSGIADINASAINYGTVTTTLSIKPIIAGTLQLTVGKHELYLGESTTGTLRLLNSDGVTTPVTLTMISIEGDGRVSFNGPSCQLTSANPTCNWELVATKEGPISIIMSAEDYNSTSQDLLILPQPKYIFVTNNTITGAVGSTAEMAIVEANNICNTDGNKPDGGTYNALLINSVYGPDITPATWVIKPRIAYKNINNEIVIPITNENLLPDNLSSAVDVSNPIDMDLRAWTGLANGDSDCYDWTSSNPNSNGITGSPSATNGTWNNSGTSSCGVQRHLYCVQQ
ncbi:MAG: DUF1554 domain-containing protein [Burkholderiales bacterium]|nr:DUF1554 domain-containing protein [Burkholderiales bacterium]